MKSSMTNNVTHCDDYKPGEIPSDHKNQLYTDEIEHRENVTHWVDDTQCEIPYSL